MGYKNPGQGRHLAAPMSLSSLSLFPTPRPSKGHSLAKHFYIVYSSWSL